MSSVREELRRAVREALDGLGAGGVEAVVEPSARPEFGDWSTPAPLRAARVLRRSPAVIAEELRSVLAADSVPHVAEWTVSGGYVNARLDHRSWAPAVIAGALSLSPAVPLTPLDGAPVSTGKTLVEHTNINTNKAAHVGHLRNACLGDAVSRMLRRSGRRVEVNNFIDDTGVQVADVVVGLRELHIEQRDRESYDRYCSRVYVEVSRRYEREPALLERRRETLQAIEAGDNDVARFAKGMSTRIVEAHLATMARFDIGYDLLTWESDILELGFWERAFALLRHAGVAVYVESGRNAGCWVMPWDEGGGAEVDDDAERQEAKVLVKSDGVATYTAKDIAYQLWKFGLLGLDFHYRAWSGGGGPATTTASGGDAALDGTGFGHAEQVVNVIDARQAYPQHVVQEALRRLGHELEARRSVHLAYEVVALSSHAAADLGLQVEEGRTLYAFSGRRGIEVGADDLLDVAIAKLREKAGDEHGTRALAAGALRYYLEKFTRTQVIAFDFGEALRTTGDTGVYLQYTHARAAGILRKAPDEGGEVSAPAELHPAERSLLHRVDGYRAALGEAVDSLSPSVLCTYAFALASALSDFYEHTPAIVREQDAEVRRFRRALVSAARATLADALTTLGIPAPDHV